MAKLLTITKCEGCPNGFVFDDLFRCLKTKKPTQRDKIPKWCPLPDAITSKQGENNENKNKKHYD